MSTTTTTSDVQVIPEAITKKPQEPVSTDPLYLALTKPGGPRDMRPWIIRQATFGDAYQMAFVACRAYYHTGLIHFLSPKRDQHPADFVRGFQMRISQRILSAAGRGWVAFPADEPETPIAYMQCERLGDDEGYMEIVADRKNIWLSIASTLYNAYVRVATWIRPDRSEMDGGALKTFLEAQDIEDKKHWRGRPDRKNRWYCKSMVVSEEWRRRGLGRALMNQMITIADRQNVPVSLEASADGEFMYSSLGFELLARFDSLFDEQEQNGGGVMLRPCKETSQVKAALQEIVAQS